MNNNNTIINEQNIVIEQIENISRNYFNYDNLISEVRNINYKNNKIGNKVKFKYDNYVEIYNNLLSQKSFHIRFQDDSLICFFYEFNDNNQIINYSLSYIPAPSEEVQIYYLENETMDILNIEQNILFKIMYDISKYIRVDYDEEGYKPEIHTSSHFHLSYIQNELRLPISSKIYPEEFLFIVLKYIYCSTDSRNKNLRINSKKISTLTNDELKLFYIKNGSEEINDL